MRKPHNFGILLFTVFLLCTQNGYAQTVNLNSPTILGELKLPGAQLESIKEAVEKALSGNIDTEYQCGEVKLDCVVRAARQFGVRVNSYFYLAVALLFHDVSE